MEPDGYGEWAAEEAASKAGKAGKAGAKGKPTAAAKKAGKAARMASEESESEPESEFDDASEDEEQYEVEAILGHKGNGKARRFKLSWVGYDDTSWEPEENIDPGMVKAYLDSLPPPAPKPASSKPATASAPAVAAASAPTMAAPPAAAPATAAPAKKGKKTPAATQDLAGAGAHHPSAHGVPQAVRPEPAHASAGAHTVTAQVTTANGGPAGASRCGWLCMVRPGHVSGASVTAWGALVQLARPSMARRGTLGYIRSNFWASAASGVLGASAQL